MKLILHISNLAIRETPWGRCSLVDGDVIEWWEEEIDVEEGYII